MNKALFWDFDGTLVASKRLWTGSYYDALKLVDPTSAIAFDDIKPLQTGFPWHKPENDYTHLVKNNAWWAHMARQFYEFYLALGLDERKAGEAAGLVRGFVLDSRKYALYPDAVQVLKACLASGYRNYILSNNYPELPEIIESLGITSLFSGCTVSAAVGYEKPRKEIFQSAIKAAGYPDVCIMIGDNPIADIAGAKAAGMSTILVHGNELCPADFVCEELTGVLDVLGIQ